MSQRNREQIVDALAGKRKRALINRAREEWWAAWWWGARLIFGLRSPQAIWCEVRWTKAWWRQKKKDTVQ